MTCNLTGTILHGYLDGELDAAGAAEFESHLERCPQCTAELEAQESLRSSIRQSRLYERAPAGLHKRVLSDLNVTKPVSNTQWGSWSWLPIAASILLLAYVGWRTLPGFSGHNQDPSLAAQLIDDHIRSLQPGHLSDVVSSDQHTVKPWFDGKLDFSPPVRDFSERGFPLQGARLEVVNGRAIGALVYGRRKHEINVFVWPDTGKEPAVQSGSRQGYNWLHWNTGSFQMWATSDASMADLEELRRLFETQ